MKLYDKFFFLNPECFVVSGRISSAIYNLYSGEIFSIDNVLAKFINICEKDKLPLNIIFADNNCFDRIEIDDELDYLCDLNLGSYYPNRVIVEKIRSPFSKYKDRRQFKPPSLTNLTIELTNICNLDCVYCDDEKNKRCGDG